MYQVMVNNPDKTVAKGENLSLSISGFPPNTKLDYHISEANVWNIVGLGEIFSDSNGGGRFSTPFSEKPGKYRLSVRNSCMGTAYADFTIVERADTISMPNVEETDVLLAMLKEIGAKDSKENVE